MAGRTDAERMELARQCAKIERSGGNVLEYLRKNGYPYTTSAVWRNLQKDFLKRKEGRITSGVPEEKHGKEENEMEKVRSVTARVNSSTLAEEVASVVILSGSDPVQHLREMGYSNPSAKWNQLRRVLQEENIELLEKVDLALIAGKEKKTAVSALQKAAGKPADAKTEELPSETPEAPQGENSAEKAAVPRPPITSCCAPARPSGVSLADMDAPADGELKIRAVENDIGTFMITEHGMTFLQKNQGEKLGLQAVHLTVEEWALFLAAAPKALRMMGLIK